MESDIICSSDFPYKWNTPLLCLPPPPGSLHNTHYTGYAARFDSDFYLVPEKAQAKEIQTVEKGCEKQTRRQVLPVGVPEERLEKFILPLSFLLPPLLLCSFCPKFSSTSIFSLPSLCLLSSNPALPHLSPPVSLFVNTSLSPPLLCALLPHHPLTACHSVTLPRRSFFPTPSSLFLLHRLHFHRSRSSCPPPPLCLSALMPSRSQRL